LAQMMSSPKGDAARSGSSSARPIRKFVGNLAVDDADEAQDEEPAQRGHRPVSFFRSCGPSIGDRVHGVARSSASSPPPTPIFHWSCRVRPRSAYDTEDEQPKPSLRPYC
jgi:hypothetical protein